jgi:hypothetical protein
VLQPRGRASAAAASVAALPCAVERLEDVADLFALSRDRELAMRGATIPAPVVQFALVDRFVHQSDSPPDGPPFCPLFLRSALHDASENADVTLGQIPDGQLLPLTALGIYEELGRRVQLGVGAERSTGSAQERLEAQGECGMAVVLRVQRKLSSLCQRLRRQCPEMADSNATALRWVWPVLLFAGQRWADGLSEDELRASPLTVPCLLWLLQQPVVRRAPDFDDEDSDDGDDEGMPPLTLLARTMLTLSVECRRELRPLRTWSEDKDGLVRSPEEEAVLASLVQQVGGKAGLYSRVGVFEYV